ncbi:MAG TPA: DUF1501 domain-containing protein [Verrucomicrobiae bacterium]
MNLEALFREENRKAVTRRYFFKECGVGLGALALASLLKGSDAMGAQTLGKADPLAPRAPQFPAKAKRVIYLFQAGGPSQLDMFNYRPELAKYDGKPIPKEIVKNQRYAFIRPDAALFASEFKFAKHGKCGTMLSEVQPHLAEVVDDIAVINSMTTIAFNHAPGQIFMNTGSTQFGRPSMGAWATYGLGSEARDLPGFVVLSSAGGTSGGAGNWGAGFLPTVYQGVPFRRSGDPILYLTDPPGITRQMQRRSLDALRELNQDRLDVVGDPEISTRINSFEMAYRMQTSAPELMDIGRESKETLEMYGAEPGKSSFANNCLLARRLVERGVRFVQLFHEAWDHHSDVTKNVRKECGLTDKPCAALIKDLKQRGLLDDTLVIWGGEFGRTPMVETNKEAGRSMGRDHHPQAFTMWLAGGGIKPGLTLGKTDDFGFNITEDPVPVHDLHATILHLLGFDHTKLTYHFQGRDFRLTDVEGNLVKKLLA